MTVTGVAVFIIVCWCYTHGNGYIVSVRAVGTGVQILLVSGLSRGFTVLWSNMLFMLIVMLLFVVLMMTISLLLLCDMVLWFVNAMALALCIVLVVMCVLMLMFL